MMGKHLELGTRTKGQVKLLASGQCKCGIIVHKKIGSIIFSQCTTIVFVFCHGVSVSRQLFRAINCCQKCILFRYWHLLKKCRRNLNWIRLITCNKAIGGIRLRMINGTRKVKVCNFMRVNLRRNLRGGVSNSWASQRALNELSSIVPSLGSRGIANMVT